MEIVYGQKFISPVENWPQNGVFGSKRGLEFTFWFATLKRHILARNCVFWCILHQNLCGSLGCRWS